MYRDILLCSNVMNRAVFFILVRNGPNVKKGSWQRNLEQLLLRITPSTPHHKSLSV